MAPDHLSSGTARGAAGGCEGTHSFTVLRAGHLLPSDFTCFSTPTTMDQGFENPSIQQRVYYALWPFSSVVYAISCTAETLLDRTKPDHEVRLQCNQLEFITKLYQRAKLLNLQKECKPAKPWVARLPFGIDLLIRAFRHARDRTVCEFFYRISEESGPTHEQRLRMSSTSVLVNVDALMLLRSWCTRIWDC